ncbi:hypothetical protein HDV01_005051 [Terramyces sp. JEL0728]|nr:hypothetical protein HDV01_005051 [Terramyces sp. JEL0728]
MRIKVQIDLDSQIKTWYTVSDHFEKFSLLLDNLSSDFDFACKDITMTMDGFELPLFLNPFSILKEDDMIIISRKSLLKRKNNVAQDISKKSKIDANGIADAKSSITTEASSAEESDSSDAESGDSSDPETSDSSDESESDSVSSDTDESEESKATKAVLQAVDPKLIKALHKNKRKAVNNMLHTEPTHQKFKENEPIVFNTKVELFNPPGTFSDNQLKRRRKVTQQHETADEYQAEQEKLEVQDWESFEEMEENEFPILEGENQAEEDFALNTQVVDAVDYTELPVLKEPQVGAEIVYKTLELSLAYTAEISDFKRAKIVSFTPTKKSFKVVLHKLQPDAPNIPSSAWEPKIHDYIYPKGRKFEVEQVPEEISIEVDWKDLIEVRLIH